MKIQVNGNEFDAPEGTTVAELVASVVADSQARGIAVALDDEVTVRSTWNNTVVTTGQRVEILQATQGG